LPRAFLLGARTAAADQDAAFLDHGKIAAFKGARGDHVIDRDAQLFIGADRGIVFAAPPPVGHGSDDRAKRRHDRTVTRINLHRQFGRGRMHMHLDPEMLIGRHQFGMLGLAELNVAGALTQMFARQRRG